MAKNKIKDIFKGKFLDIWGDEELVTINLAMVSVTLDREEFSMFMKDIKRLSKQ